MQTFKHDHGDYLWDHCVIEESSCLFISLSPLSLRRPDCKEARWPLLPRQRSWRKRRSGSCGGATLCWRGWSTTAREPCRSWAARVTVPVPTVPAGTSARQATAVGRPAAAPITTSCGVSAVYINTSHRLDSACHRSSISELHASSRGSQMEPYFWWTSSLVKHENAFRARWLAWINTSANKSVNINAQVVFIWFQPPQILSLFSFFEIQSTNYPLTRFCEMFVWAVLITKP